MGFPPLKHLGFLGKLTRIDAYTNTFACAMENLVMFDFICCRYSWRIIECRVCRNHLGWKFEAVERLKPSKFWGLAKRSVNFKYDFSIENDCPDLDAPPSAPQRTRSESTNSDAGEEGSRRHPSESSSAVSLS